MTAKKTVLIGLLGPTLDYGMTPQRWEGWRPSVAICQHEELLIHRFELLHQKRFDKLAATVVGDIQSVSPETTVVRRLVEFDDAWDFEQVYEALYEFARGCTFNIDDEDYLIHITTGTHVAQICLFLLTESRHFPARLLQSAPPAKQRAGRTVGTYRIIDLDLSKYDRLATRFAVEGREGQSFLKGGIDTRNPRFNQLISQIEHVAVNSPAPILLTGPTGAGKSKLARRIYELKKHRNQVAGGFVEVNCATLRGDAAMSALFGHVRGAFTGAVSDRPGLLRAAHEGVLFLDEIGELGNDEQAMLLRALEEGRFLPVGSDKEAGSAFQLIAGTNRDLAAAVAQGRFREDLLARINLWTFSLPGLAQRQEDIEPNLRFELDQIAARTGRKATFNKEALRRFMDFAVSGSAVWHANFRDLNAAVTRMVTLSPGGRITEQAVEDEVRRLRSAWEAHAPGGDAELLAGALDPARLDEIDLFDRVQLAEVIRLCRRSRSLSEAGRELFAASRRQRSVPNDADRLRKYLARFGLAWQQIHGTGDGV